MLVAFEAYGRPLTQCISPQEMSSFLGITLDEAFLEEYEDVTPKRQRATTGEPEHFDKDAKSPPDMTNPEHVEWARRAQKILGALAINSNKTRLGMCSQLSCPVLVAQP